MLKFNFCCACFYANGGHIWHCCSILDFSTNKIYMCLKWWEHGILAYSQVFYDWGASWVGYFMTYIQINKEMIIIRSDLPYINVHSNTSKKISHTSLVKHKKIKQSTLVNCQLCYIPIKKRNLQKKSNI